jgi:hypothetical protein
MYADFEAYDVLQVNDPQHGWMDFATLRDEGEAARSVQIVDTRGDCSRFNDREYRVIGRKSGTAGRFVKYGNGIGEQL